MTKRVVELKFQKGLLDSEVVRVGYQMAGVAFKVIFGYEPRDDVELLLSEAWDAAACKTTEESDTFYHECLLVTEEVAKWHEEKNGQRVRRVIHAGTIAKQLGLKSFCEVGCGIGTDGIALMRLGFDCTFLAEVNRHSLLMAKRCAELGCVAPRFVDLMSYTKENATRVYGHADWLYSSDVFEHIFDLEGWLDGWIQGFKAVIVYAPFGKSERNHTHTEYGKDEFNSFMATQGFDKIKIRGLGVPPMVYSRG